jgi:hypothetical protein
MKKALIAFCGKELLFIVIALLIGFIQANPCLERSDIEYGVCDMFYIGTTAEWVFKSLSVWLILKIGQGLGRFIHSCEEELKRKKDRESNLLEKKRMAVLLDHIEAVELGIREPDETYYRYWQNNRSSKQSLDTLNRQESKEQRPPLSEEEKKQKEARIQKTAEALVDNLKRNLLLEHIEAVENGQREPDEEYYNYVNHIKESPHKRPPLSEEQKKINQERATRKAEALAKGIRESKDN